MRHIFAWLSRRRWFISLPLLILAGVGVYLGIAALLDWANSTAFCGTTCHTMTPEYTAYQRSFHARVRCAECHIGPGLLAEVEAKWQGLRELWLYVTNTYERPIPSPVENLRPARDTCEHCHWPEVFYQDRAVAIPHFANDQANTRSTTYMLVKIGGGTHRRGQGRGIHWHIENRVEYIATDPQRQHIPWVRAQLNGKVVTFVDMTEPLSEAELARYGIRTMDCIDCHNRATHIFRSAEQAVDEAMANGLLSSDLPYLRKKAVEVMKATYPDQKTALEAIAALEEYYRQNDPRYAEHKEEVAQAIRVLQDIYSASHFPDYKVYPETYPDNIGHSESPGCFRCHDGKHLAADGTSIRLHCNICHTIPQTVPAGQSAPAISFQSPDQPPNHLASNWMAEHRTVMDASCATCHPMETFCANPNCHGRSWPYVDLEAVSPPFPLPTPVPASPTPQATPVASSPTPVVPSDAVQRGAGLYIEKCVSCHALPERLLQEESEREEFISAVRSGRKGMPPFPLTDAQMEALITFVLWWAQAHPGEVLRPTPVPISSPTAGPVAVPSFSREILPMLQKSCGSSCHSATAAAGGFKAVDYTGIRSVVIPGDPAGSRLVQVQRGNHPVRLSPAELELVIEWIRAGAPDN